MSSRNLPGRSRIESPIDAVRDQCVVPLLFRAPPKTPLKMPLKMPLKTP